MAENSSDITLSAPVLYLLLAAIGIGGGGVVGIAGRELNSEILTQCVDQSETALQVAAQHGQEFVELRQQLGERTRLRYTSADAESDQRKQTRVDEIQDRGIEANRAEIQDLDVHVRRLEEQMKSLRNP